MIFDGDLYEKRGESNDNVGWEMAENRVGFANKLVMSNLTKTYAFWQ